jgi:NSS family neurotransmitter:Na+ symporter
MAEREKFGSITVAIMAFAGSAIGLGNIWRFPYVTGENGGGLFVLLFCVFTLILAMPIFIAESVIGRKSGASCLGAVRKLTDKKFWRVFGMLSVITPVFIAGYYCVVGGWSLDFLLKSLAFSFSRTSPEEAGAMFPAFMASSWKPLVMFTGFLALTALIPAFGIKSGIELFNKISIPILFAVIVAVAIFSISLPDAEKGAAYLLEPDWSKFSWRACAAAAGQSFYSLSLGMGIIITYSSYVDRKEDLPVTAVGTAVAGLIFSLIAGLAILPAVFSAGISPSAGPGLIFETLPYIFSKMGAEQAWISSAVAILFFLSVLVAALTSSISLIEVGISYLIEEHGLSRIKACACCFAFCWVLGAVCIFDMDIFSIFDHFSSDFLIIINGLLGALFVGWVMKKSDVRDEITSSGTLPGAGKVFPFLYAAIRFFAPVLILLILLTGFIK